MSLCSTAGQRHEAIGFEPLISTGAVKRPGRGHPRLRPQRIVGDKGYCGLPVRRLLRRRGIRFTIAKCSNKCRAEPFDKELYRQRNTAERTINRLAIQTHCYPLRKTGGKIPGHVGYRCHCQGFIVCRHDLVRKGSYRTRYSR